MRAMTGTIARGGGESSAISVLHISEGSKMLEINQTRRLAWALPFWSVFSVAAFGTEEPVPKPAVETAPSENNPIFRFDRNGTTTVPVALIQDSIYVQLQVNGQALWFLLDSGSSFMLIDRETAKAMSLSFKGGRAIQGAGAGKVQIDYVVEDLA